MMRPAKILALAMLLAAAAPAGGKPAAGELAGVVLSAKGVPVAWAQVYWQAADGQSPHSLHAGPSGRFHVSLRPGLYDLRAEGNGRWSEWEHNVLVRRGEEASVTLRLMAKNPR